MLQVKVKRIMKDSKTRLIGPQLPWHHQAREECKIGIMPVSCHCYIRLKQCFNDLKMPEAYLAVRPNNSTRNRTIAGFRKRYSCATI